MLPERAGAVSIADIDPLPAPVRSPTAAIVGRRSSMFVALAIVLVLTPLALTLAACGSTNSTSDAPPTQATATATPVAGQTSFAVAEQVVVPYGNEESQFGEITTPAKAGPHPVVVLVHGGFWKAMFAADLMEPLRDDLVQRGYAVWNIEYRRVGEPGGGWPGTLDDVAAAVDHLAVMASEYDLDLDQVAVVGHSAGGQLAIWTAGRIALADDAPGANPVVQPAVVVGQAPILDLVNGANDGVGNGDIQRFLGGEPDEVPERYEIASAGCNCTVDTRFYLTHGTNDVNVPLAYGNLDSMDAAQFIYEGADHFDVIDPTHQSWLDTVAALDFR